MSNPILTHKRIRIKFDASEFKSQRDILTSATPEMYRGNWARFEVIVYWKDAIADLSNVASLTLKIMGTDRSTAKVSKTISAAEITTVPTASGWTDGSAQHAAFEFTGEEMNFSLGESLLEETFYLVLSGVTNDSPGHDITYGTSSLKLIEDGVGAAGTPPVNDPLYYTQADADARFAQLMGDGYTFRIKKAADGNTYMQFYFQSEGKWRSRIPVTVDGKPSETWGDPED